MAKTVADDIGRDSSGRFAAGNTFGKASRARELRRAFVDAVTVEDIEDVARTLVTMAKGGDIHAAKLLLDRAIGKVVAPTDEESHGSDGSIEGKKQRVFAALRRSGQN